MMESQGQGELFGRPPAYPDYPASRPADTSREAARAIASHAATLRARVLRHLVVIHPRGKSPDEIAAALDASILSIRPRCSELKRSGLIETTPQRSRNASGLQARQMRATALALQQDH